MKRAGISFIELLVAMAIMMILFVAVSSVYSNGLTLERKSLTARTLAEAKIRFEERLKKLLRSATLGTTAGDPYAYFISPSSVAATTNSTNSNGADSVVFTTLGARLPAAYLQSKADFETLNQTYGPRGGRAEIALSPTPFEGSSTQTGFFIRIQRPADGDATQGGFERVFEPNVQSLLFEFYDGTNWIARWDSANTEVGRLPAAVRVTYTWAGESEERTFIVQLLQSDVTPQNPVAGSVQ